MELRVEGRWIAIGAALTALFVLAGASYIAFTYYKNSLSRQAYGVFVQRSKQFSEVTPEAEQAVYKQLADGAVEDYTQFKNSAYAGFFLALAADVYEQAGDKQQALTLMDKALPLLSHTDPVLYFTYATKHALMQVDSSDMVIQSKGRQALEKLAHNPKNPVKDMVWFYLGYQAYLEHDQQGVQMGWSKLIDQNGRPISNWGVRAQNLLNYTTL